MTKPTEKTPANAIQEAQATIKSAIQSLTAQAAEKQALINGYRAEVHALNQAPIGFEDYAGFVRQNMRAAASSIVAGFNERILSSMSGRIPMNKVPMSDFEMGAGVFQDGFGPTFFEGVTHWNMLCFLGGEPFEDAFIEKLRSEHSSRWGSDQAMPVAQRRVRIAELGQLIDQEQAAKRAIDADLQALTS